MFKCAIIMKNHIETSSQVIFVDGVKKINQNQSCIEEAIQCTKANRITCKPLNHHRNPWIYVSTGHTQCFGCVQNELEIRVMWSCCNRSIINNFDGIDGLSWFRCKFKFSRVDYHDIVSHVYIWIDPDEFLVYILQCLSKMNTNWGKENRYTESLQRKKGKRRGRCMWKKGKVVRVLFVENGKSKREVNVILHTMCRYRYILCWYREYDGSKHVCLVPANIINNFAIERPETILLHRKPFFPSYVSCCCKCT